MPRYMTLIRIDEQASADWEPDPGFEQRMGALFEEITKAGVMLETAGLTPTAQGTRLTWNEGKLGHTDGPFTETKEVIGGYAILQCKDRAEALEWTRRFLQTHPAGWSVGAEVRQIDEQPQLPK
ncbi:transcriptional regulator [Kitasatospora xanthocidica]|uniref:YciI family protein n=1 Tax=Kitasatospora xanthocidica TaxID=83382 RepID=UPI00167548F4|nr:YciI family protein [Kitasatospora xanthocidica]GHF87982.1 transcriptional regulator [Kitasatospora xanthocidica]